ncbi:MAG: helicase HerA-like domain-containing protein [Candidatus Thermoplasmatota archaeon]|nr:helicase HerA-like domain-containing protein [Candidatus Thermoplasmatota archaeon]
MWIVIGEEKGMIKLVSKSGTNGILPKGSYLTVEQGEEKFILKVEESIQGATYSPSPLIADMDLTPISGDRRCQNIVYATRIRNIPDRPDGLLSYILPQSTARRSTQEEIDGALGGIKRGPKVFIATVQYGESQHLFDDYGNMITAKLPEEMFYYQTLICGRTGSGKTVAAKYLAQYFVEELKGAVLAVNVKESDLLKMDKPSETKNPEVIKEWENLKVTPHGVFNFTVYYPATTTISFQDIDPRICKAITLDIKNLDPESLTGLLHGITDVGAMNLPGIFRYWREEEAKNVTFAEFKDYFSKGAGDKCVFKTKNTKGEISEVTLHRGTFDNINRNLDYASDFFDNPNSKSLTEEDVLVSEKMSVINVAGEKGIEFGSVLLRDLLKRIVSAKSNRRSTVPILIIIDEVHMFYNTESSREALGSLDTICRTGRSQQIGVIFSSQNLSDIPSGLSSVINTMIFFKSTAQEAKKAGVNMRDEEMEGMKKGFAIASIHGSPYLKVIKFPLAFAGVLEGE